MQSTPTTDLSLCWRGSRRIQEVHSRSSRREEAHFFRNQTNQSLPTNGEVERDVRSAGFQPVSNLLYRRASSLRGVRTI